MLVDLHGFCLNDAVEEVVWKLNELISAGKEKLDIVHGFRRGQVLKNYFQSNRFLQDMKKFGFQLKPKFYANNPGLTCYQVLRIKQD